jgi:phenylacetate-CoA ligase
MLNHLPKSQVIGIGFPALPSASACSHLAMQYQLDVSQWQSPNVLLQNQLAQLKRVVDHAYRTVPYYRALFEKHNISIPDELSLEFLRTIPISLRQMVQEAGETLRSQNLPSAHGKPHDVSTSGSTGRPVRLLGTAVTRFFWRAFVLREHTWHKRDMTKKLGMIRWARRDVGTAPTGLHMPAWPVVNLVYDTGPACMLNVATPLNDQLDWLLSVKPHYLLSFPSNLAALAKHCLERDITLLNLDEVRTIGETLTGQQRSLFRQAWGVKAVDLYSCEEAGYLAIQCPSHDHYHVQSENVLVEIVDGEGRPCAVHQPGRVLITTLHNYATPLIRYELGDFAEFGEQCSCGRGLPVIRKIHGRKRSRLILTDGRSEFPYLGEHGQIQKATGVRVRQYQLVQRSVEQVEVRLVTDRKFTESEASKVADLVRSNLGHPFEVTITHWDEIPRGPTGKFDEFVCHVVS